MLPLNTNDKQNNLSYNLFPQFIQSTDLSVFISKTLCFPQQTLTGNHILEKLGPFWGGPFKNCKKATVLRTIVFTDIVDADINISTFSIFSLAKKSRMSKRRIGILVRWNKLQNYCQGSCSFSLILS